MATHDFEYFLGRRSYFYSREDDEIRRIAPDECKAAALHKTALISDFHERYPFENMPGAVKVQLDQSHYLELTTGLNLVVGGTSTGKSTLLERLYESLLTDESALTTYLEYCEPSATATVDEQALADATATAILATDPSVLLIDSWREYAYASNAGATGRGGIDMSLFARMTALDIAALRSGTVIVAVLNPLTTDDDALNFYKSAAEGSVTTLLTMDRPGSIRYVTRRPDKSGNTRRPLKITWKPEPFAHDVKAEMVFESFRN